MQVLCLCHTPITKLSRVCSDRQAMSCLVAIDWSGLAMYVVISKAFSVCYAQICEYLGKSDGDDERDSMRNLLINM